MKADATTTTDRRADTTQDSSGSSRSHDQLTASPAPSAIQTFDLTRQLPHLLRRAHFKAEAHFAPLFGEHITSRQLALLVAVGRNPGASQSTIAHQIGLDLNTFSDLVSRLRNKNFVRRERSTADRRVHCLHLTEEGRSAMENCLPLTPRYARTVASRLTQAQMEQLVDLLRGLLGFDGATDADRQAP